MADVRLETDGLALTDDEIVALAVDSGRPWTGVLPTVDQLDAEAMARAAVRGQRSLHVRRLVDSAELRRWEHLLAHGVRLAAYAQNAEGEMLSGSYAVYAFGQTSSSAWLRDVVTPVGVHYLAEVRPENVIEAVVEMVQDAATPGRAFLPDEGSLAVVWPTAGGFSLSSVNEQRVAVQELSTTADAPGVPSDVTAISRAIRSLIATAV